MKIYTKLIVEIRLGRYIFNRISSILFPTFEHNGVGNLHLWIMIYLSLYALIIYVYYEVGVILYDCWLFYVRRQIFDAYPELENKFNSIYKLTRNNINLDLLTCPHGPPPTQQQTASVV